MERGCHMISQAHDYLKSIQRRIEEVRQQNESTCRDIDDLLKKPWPGRSTAQQKQPSSNRSPQVTGNRKDEGQDSDDLLISEEHSMLSEVDSMLAKAHKLRQFQNKVKEKQLGKTEQILNSTKTAAVRVPAKSATDGADNSLDQSEQPTCRSAGDAGGDMIEEPDVAIISAKDLNRLLKKDPPRTKQKNASVACPSSGSHRVSSSTGSRKTSTSLERTGAKTSVRKDAQFKTSSAEIGKHVKRPSSRYEGTQSRYKQSAQSKPPQRDIKPSRITNPKYSNQSNSLPRLPQGNSSGSASAQQTSGHTAKRTERDNIQQKRAVQGSHNANGTARSGKEQGTDLIGGRERRSGDVGTLAGAVQEVKLSSSENRSVTGNPHSSHPSKAPVQDSTPEDEEIPFMLKRDGSTLVVPSKLRKLYQSNAKLRDKLSSCLQKENLNNSNVFLSKLEPNPMETSSSSIQSASERLSQEYQHLIRVTAELKKQMNAIHSYTHWEDIYYIHSMVKGIRERHREINRQFKQLTEMEDQLSSSLPKKEKTLASVSGRAPDSSSSSPFLWPGLACSGPDRPVCVSGGNIMQYTSLPQLLEWNRLVFQVQYLQQEKNLQKIAGDAVLSLLGEIDPTDPAYSTLYRMTHGVILNSGAIFPSMIADDDRGTTPLC